MIETDITVQYVNPPKEGKKRGTIKTTDDVIYGVFDLLDRFAVGCKYTIGYETHEFDAGRGDGPQTYKTIKKVVAGPPPGQALTASRGSPSMTKSEEMFVMGVIGRSLQGTGVIPEYKELVRMVRALRSAWTEGFEDIPHATAPPPDFDDDISGM